jgi:hypothetical protein
VESIDPVTKEPTHGFRLLGKAKMSRTVRVLTVDDPLYLEAVKELRRDPRAAQYLAQFEAQNDELFKGMGWDSE